MSARSPVVTGLGIVTAVGCGVDEVWSALARGESGLKPLSLFQSPRYGQILVGEIRDDLASLGAPRRGSRSDRLGWIAAQQAIDSAGIDVPSHAERTGIVLGCSVGGSYDSERFLINLIRSKRMWAAPTRYHECVSVVDIIAQDFGLLGPSMAVATACSSGGLAISNAAEMILSGQADVMLAGGADSLARMTWGGFHSLLLVDESGCKPFDEHRAGMTLGEGAAMLVIEAEETAVRRGAPILARLGGWGASCDAYHVTAPHPDGAGALAAMQAALRRAGLSPSDIDYINAHGTGTRDNDLAEARALRQLFEDRVPPFSSTKRFFGHALAASGAMEAVICVEALRRQITPSNPGFSRVDPAIGIQPVTQSGPASLKRVMSNSFGFGGNNSVLVLSHADTESALSTPSSKPIVVTGLGVIGPGTRAERDIEPPLPPGSVSVFDCGSLAAAARSLSANQRRRLSRLSQMALLCAKQIHEPVSGEHVAVTIGTGMGFLGAAGNFLENYISKEEREPKPSQFPASVHNTAASQIAIDLGARAMNSAPTAGEISFECALWQGISQLATGSADRALTGAVDELNKYLLSIGKRWGLWTERTRPGEGAVVASLAHDDGETKALGRVTAVRLGRYRRPFDGMHEAAWIASATDLTDVDVIVSGAGGWPDLDPMYAATVSALSKRAGRKFEHHTYKQSCGEYHSASGYGFSVALDLVRERGRGVVLYTLSMRGGKAICCLQP